MLIGPPLCCSRPPDQGGAHHPHGEGGPDVLPVAGAPSRDAGGGLLTTLGDATDSPAPDTLPGLPAVLAGSP
jgi:hypothetical protein